MTTKEERAQMRANILKGITPPPVTKEAVTTLVAPARSMTAGTEPLVEKPAEAPAAVKPAEAATKVERQIVTPLVEAAPSALDDGRYDRPPRKAPPPPPSSRAGKPRVTEESTPSMIVKSEDVPASSEAKPATEERTDEAVAPVPIIPPVASAIVSGSARKPSRWERFKAFYKKEIEVGVMLVAAGIMGGLLTDAKDCDCIGKGPKVVEKVVEKVVKTKCYTVDPVKITARIPAPKLVEPKKEEPKPVAKKVAKKKASSGKVSIRKTKGCLGEDIIRPDESTGKVYTDKLKKVLGKAQGVQNKILIADVIACKNKSITVSLSAKNLDDSTTAILDGAVKGQIIQDITDAFSRLPTPGDNSRFHVEWTRRQ